MKQSHDFDCDSEESEHSEDFYFIEIGVWSSHLVVSDKLIGKAFLNSQVPKRLAVLKAGSSLKTRNQKMPESFI